MATSPRGSCCGWILVILATTLATWAGSARANAAEQQTNETRQIVVRLSRDVFDSLVEDQVDRTTDVTDVILGASVRGRARTRGVPKLDLIPDRNRGSFLITLTGTNVSRTVGRSGPAIVYTRAETRFAATKRITFEAGKGFVAQPARINSNTRTTTEGVSSTRRGFIGRIVVRRAWRKVTAMRPQVDAIARQRAETRIRAAFDQSVETRLARVNQSTDLRSAVAMLLGGDVEPQFATSSTPDYLQVIATAGQLPAEVSLPLLEKPAAPVQVWVHQSVFGEGLASMLKLLENADPGGGLAAKALEVVPAVMKQFGPLEQAGVKPSLNYASAGDWMVIQVGADGPARLAAGATGPGGSPQRGIAAAPSAGRSTRAEPDRIWTSVDGRFTCLAGLVSATPQLVQLRRARDGKIITVQLWRLSELDQRVARSAAAGRS